VREESKDASCASIRRAGVWCVIFGDMYCISWQQPRSLLITHLVHKVQLLDPSISEASST